MANLLSSEQQRVFIASSSHDAPTWEPVARGLSDKGLTVTVYEADKVASGETGFNIHITNNEIQFLYNNEHIALPSIGAAWYRRLGYIADSSDNAAKQLGLDNERRLLLSGLWKEIPDYRWMNSPERIDSAGRKLAQLRVAAKLGFNIPNTVVSNRWGPITHSLSQKVIYKPAQAMIFDGENFLSIFTTDFDNSNDTLPTDQNPFPGIWQDLLEKAREWRVTVVGDRVFSAAIYSSADAKDDWRKHQMDSNKIKFSSESLPVQLQELCLKYLGEVGLSYGAFDFVEDNDGRVTFLECNPNGQYMWLEQSLNLPISTAIIDHLAATARSQNSVIH